MTRAWLGICMVLVGCDGGGTDDKTDDTQETGQPPSDTDTDQDTDTDTDTDIDTDTDTDTTGCPTVYTGPTVVEEASVTCIAADLVRFDTRTAGLTRSGLIYAIETANVSPWDDEHDLVSYQYDPCGFEDNLERELTTDATPATWARNQTTAFTCAEHFESNVMTYAARMYDENANFADCLVWGHDPEGVRDQNYMSLCVNCPARFTELANCVVGQMAK